ncbi:hypothetical protein BDE36_4634 [Arcticibacter tournemirensis]|nr:hypothetical protein BDE36_4634 [Arcticibacter tournemirensis]
MLQQIYQGLSFFCVTNMFYVTKTNILRAVLKEHSGMNIHNGDYETPGSFV